MGKEIKKFSFGIAIFGRNQSAKAGTHQRENKQINLVLILIFAVEVEKSLLEHKNGKRNKSKSAMVLLFFGKKSINPTQTPQSFFKRYNNYLFNKKNYVLNER